MILQLGNDLTVDRVLSFVINVALIIELESLSSIDSDLRGRSIGNTVQLSINNLVDHSSNCEVLHSEMLVRDGAFDISLVNTDELDAVAEGLAKFEESLHPHIDHLLLEGLQTTSTLQNRFSEEEHTRFAILDICTFC